METKLCDICGERPAVVNVLFTGGGQRPGAVCERCARQAAAAQGAGPFAGPRAAGPQSGEDKSDTPALDEFGRDLTREAREGRIDAVVGRAEEIEQTIEILARRRKNNA